MAREADRLVNQMRRSLVCFAEQSMKFDGLADMMSWVNYDMLERIQVGEYPKGVLGNRGIGKSTFVTELVTCWRLYGRPDTKSLLLSKDKPTAVRFLTGIKSRIRRYPWLNHLDAYEMRRTHRWANTEIDVAPCDPIKQPSVACVSTRGVTESNRCHFMIADDCETRQNTITVEARDALEEFFTEMMNLASWDPGPDYGGGEGSGVVIWIGTYRHDFDSVYTRRAKKGDQVIAYPVLAPKHDEHVPFMSPGVRKKMESGELMPGDIVAADVITPKRVAKLQREGRRVFMREHMLIPVLSGLDKFPLRLSNLIVFPVDRTLAPTQIAYGHTAGKGTSTAIEGVDLAGFDGDRFYGPAWVSDNREPYHRTVMAIDPAGSGPDLTGYAIVSSYNSMLYTHVANGIGAKGQPCDEMMLHKLVAIARQRGVNLIRCEMDYGGDNLINILQSVVNQYSVPAGEAEDCPQGWSATVEGFHAARTASKEQRILQVHESLFASHRHVIDPEVAANTLFQRQITRLSSERNALSDIGDDIIDAWSEACRPLSSALSYDIGQAEKDIARKRVEAIIERRRERYRLPEPDTVNTRHRGFHGTPISDPARTPFVEPEYGDEIDPWGQDDP